MQRPSPGGMFNLLPAGDSGSDNDGVRILFNRGKQTPAANRYRNIVVFFFISERAGHAAATGIDFLYGIGERDCLIEIAGTDQRFFVAMSVNQSLLLLPLELQFPTAFLLFFNYEFF